MSLNGLDTPDVLEASQTAAIEPAGWFLLHYTTRDSVGLLAKGKAGVGEARNAITAYSEASPLYGLIMYRRRKILIKYVPEGTSRLLQARTAVHLQDILERYSPYETLLEITTSEDLNDTALAASFPLHTASQSVASNRLREISEDGEEIGTGVKPRSTVSAAQRFRERKAEHALKSDTSSPRPESTATPTIQVMTDDVARPSSPRSPVASPTRRRNFSRQFMASAESGHQSISTIGSVSDVSAIEHPVSENPADDVEFPRSAAPTIQPLSGISTADTISGLYARNSNDRPRTADVRLPTGMSETGLDYPDPPERRSLSKLRPVDENDPYDIEKFFKPKVKLGPRPVADGEMAKRQSAAGIASVPATYRPLQQKQRQSSRMPLQDPITSYVAPPTAALNMPLPLPPPVPTMPEYNPRPVSRGSIKSLPSHKSTAMTPDKLRLMKAVEMRKKRMRQSNAQETASLAPPIAEAITPVPELPELIEPTPVEENRTEPVLENGPTAATLSRENDSGIEMEYEKLRGSEDTTQTDMSIDHSSDPISAKTEMVPTAQDQKLNGQQGNALPVLDAIQGAFPSIPILENKKMLEQNRQDTIRQSEPLPQQREQLEKPKIDSTEPQALTRELKATPSSPSRLREEVMKTDTAEPVARSEEVLGSNNKTTTHQDHRIPAQEVNELIPQAYSQLTGSVEPPEQLSYAGNKQPGKGDLMTAPPITVPTIIMPDLPSAGEKIDLSDPTTPVQAPHDLTNEDDSPDLGLPLQNPDSSVKRRGMVEPLTLNTEPDLSSSDDDDLLDELHAVTFQDARSITVSKSPVTRFFTRRPSATSAASEDNSLKKESVEQNATIIQHDRFVEDSNRFSPSPSLANPISLRSTTSPLPEKNENLPASIRRNVSTGISKRIQALAEQSSRETSPPAGDGHVRSTAVPLKSRGSTYRSPSHSRATTSDGPVSANATSTQAAPSTWSMQVDPVTNQEAVSVSTRISPPHTEPSVDAGTTTTFTMTTTTIAARPESSLRQSHTALNHGRTTSQSPSSTSQTAPQRSESRTSSTSASSAILNRTFGRHRAQSSIPTAEQFPVPPTHTTNDSVPSTSSGASIDENSVPKDGTRTSRFFKRVSNLGSKRKTPTSQPQPNGVPRPSGNFNSGMSTTSTATLTTMREDRESTNSAAIVAPPAIVVGNLNVQFPDTLLWKRRILSIDSSGNLAFSIPQAMEHQKSLARKFPLVDFHQPYIPDLDRQELPNSVMFDFRDGSTTLQAACEDGVAQREIVGVLRTYWRVWNGA